MVSYQLLNLFYQYKLLNPTATDAEAFAAVKVDLVRAEGKLDVIAALLNAGTPEVTDHNKVEAWLRGLAPAEFEAMHKKPFTDQLAAANAAV